MWSSVSRGRLQLQLHFDTQREGRKRRRGRKKKPGQARRILGSNSTEKLYTWLKTKEVGEEEIMEAKSRKRNGKKRPRKRNPEGQDNTHVYPVGECLSKVRGGLDSYWNSFREAFEVRKKKVLASNFFINYIFLKCLRVSCAIQLTSILCQYVTMSAWIFGPLDLNQHFLSAFQAMNMTTVAQDSSLGENWDERLVDINSTQHSLQGQVYWHFVLSWISAERRSDLENESGQPAKEAFAGKLHKQMSELSKDDSGSNDKGLDIFPFHIFLAYSFLFSLAFVIFDLFTFAEKPLDLKGGDLRQEEVLALVQSKLYWWFLKPLTTRAVLFLHVFTSAYICLSLWQFGQLPHNFGSGDHNHESTCILMGPLKSHSFLTNLLTLLSQSSWDCYWTLESGIVLSLGCHYAIELFLISKRQSCPNIDLMMRINKSVLRSSPKIRSHDIDPCSPEEHLQCQQMRKARSELYFFDHYKVGNVWDQVKELLGLDCWFILRSHQLAQRKFLLHKCHNWMLLINMIKKEGHKVKKNGWPVSARVIDFSLI